MALLLLLLSASGLLNVVSTPSLITLLLLCPRLIVRDLPGDDGHEILNAIREHVLDRLGLLLVLIQNVLQHIFLS